MKKILFLVVILLGLFFLFKPQENEIEVLKKEIKEAGTKDLKYIYKLIDEELNNRKLNINK